MNEIGNTKYTTDFLMTVKYFYPEPDADSINTKKHRQSALNIVLIYFEINENTFC
jgi:hypothetical protein